MGCLVFIFIWVFIYQILYSLDANLASPGFPTAPRNPSFKAHCSPRVPPKARLKHPNCAGWLQHSLKCTRGNQLRWKIASNTRSIPCFLLPVDCSESDNFVCAGDQGRERDDIFTFCTCACSCGYVYVCVCVCVCV